MVKKKRTKTEKPNDGVEIGGFSYSTEPEVTDYLTPVGIPGIYQSPVEPVDPHDCERWPESPFCGSNPLNTDFIDLTPDFSTNPCETCITFSPVLGHISLPPYTVCSRSSNPECQVPQPQPSQPVDESEAPGIGEIPMPFDPDGLAGQCAGEIYMITLLGEVVSQPGESHEYTPTSRPSVVEYVRGPIRNARLVEFYRDDFYGYSLWGAALNHGGMVSRNSTWVPNSDSGYRTYTYNPSWFVSDDGYLDLRWKISRPDGRTVDYCDDPENAPIAPPVPAPPYLIDNGEPCCMSCSPDSEELLRLIAKRLGANNYPVSVPESLLADRGNNVKELQSLTEFLHWQTLQLDALLGQFPVKIKIKDVDAAKEGDQSKEINVPNIAEALAELIGITMNASVNTDSLINIGVRNLYEANLAKNAAIVAQDLARANAEFLDYELKEIDREVPASFTLGEIELDQILKESKHNIRTYDNVDKVQLRDYMTEFLQAVSIIRAAFWRKLDPNGDYKSQIKDILTGINDLVGNKFVKTEDGKVRNRNPDDDFDQFTNKIEEGFITQSGIEDGQNPYLRNYSQRPKIRQIGNTAD